MLEKKIQTDITGIIILNLKMAAMYFSYFLKLNVSEV